MASVSFIPLLAVALGGSPQAAKLPGKWKVKSVSLPIAGPAAKEAKKIMMAATLQVSKDQTFTLNLVGPMRGTWSVKGSDVALTITEMMGRKMSDIVAMARAKYINDPSPRNKAALDELSRPMRGTLSTNGKTLTIKPAPDKAGLVFTKAE